MPAAALSRCPVDVPTPDGVADSYFVTPEGGDPKAAVVFFMDAIGLRPRLEEMADRIAERGFAVLVPNLFYRAGRAPVVPNIVERLRTEDRAAVFADIGPLIRALSPELAARDTQAYVDFLDARCGAGPIATTGYCMGGALSLRAASSLPDRVVAAASFHGGNLATEDQTSPHRGVDRIRAEVYVAHADHDTSMPSEQIERLESALNAAGVTHTSEVYVGAAHGFTMSDMAVHDPAAEQRHWDALLGLLERTAPIS